MPDTVKTHTWQTMESFQATESGLSLWLRGAKLGYGAKMQGLGVCEGEFKTPRIRRPRLENTEKKHAAKRVCDRGD